MTSDRPPLAKADPGGPWSEQWAQQVLRDTYERVREDGTLGTGQRPIFRRGAGPSVILLHEIAGVTPPLVVFAEKLVESGFSVLLPSLYGDPGRRATGRRLLSSFAHVCLSNEFFKLRTGEPSPVTAWLREIAAKVSPDGPVGVIGLCLSGGFALAMALESPVRAAVVGQPSLPFPIGRQRARDCGVSDGMLSHLATRTDLRIFGVRYSHDRLAPCARFDRLSRLLGNERFGRRELDSGARNPDGTSGWAHATLTNELLGPSGDGDPRQPGLLRLREDVIAFLRDRLSVDREPASSTT